MNDSGHQKLLKTIGKHLQNAKRILVVSHIHPDGDAVGSTLGFGLSLQAVGKEVQLVLPDGVPSDFRHLEGADKVVNHPNGQFDLVCVLDCSDLGRTGNALIDFGIPDLNIDHHVTNQNFARLNLIDYSAVATAQILAEIMPALQLPINPPVASALLTGIVTDSIGFRTSNMTPAALRSAADLMERGANLPELYRLGLTQQSYEASAYWGAGLSKLQRKNGLVWTTLTISDRKAVGYPGRDDADLINILSTIDGAEVVIVFIEQPHSKVKVSWRSQPGYDVAKVALKFGGGGHPSAAGAEISGELEQVQKEVLQATQALFLLETHKNLEPPCASS